MHIEKVKFVEIRYEYYHDIMHGRISKSDFQQKQLLQLKALCIVKSIPFYLTDEDGKRIALIAQ